MSGLWKSFIPGFYRRVARQPVPATVRFLLVFIMVISFLFAARAVFDVNPALRSAQVWAKANLQKISGDLPVIEIKDGALVQPKSTYVREVSPDFVFAVEPDSRKENELTSKYKNVFMITEKQFVFKQTGADSRAEERRRDLNKDSNLRIYPIERGIELDLGKKKIAVTPLTVEKWLHLAAVLAFPVLFLFLFIYFCFAKLLQILFFSIFALAANALLRAGLEYKNLFNICSYALVPPVSLAVFLGLFPFFPPGFWFIFTAVYILYIFLGLRAVRNNEELENA